jgi:hypothetical protein
MRKSVVKGRVIILYTALSVLRMGKPFNPLLGETYQLEQEHFRIVCEQVTNRNLFLVRVSKPET